MCINDDYVIMGREKNPEHLSRCFGPGQCNGGQSVNL